MKRKVWPPGSKSSPMFGARWRWNATRALAVLRSRGQGRVPFPVQRMQADDLMAAVFPDPAACQENVTGPIEIPEHPLVRQTVEDWDAYLVDGAEHHFAELKAMLDDTAPDYKD